MKTPDTFRDREQTRNTPTRSGMLRLLTAGFGFAAVSTMVLAQNPAATIQVDASSNRRAISPLIYGANWADLATISDLNLSVNRRGGNATTTYNWQANATNRAGDWYFESLSDGQGDLSLPSVGADEFTNTSHAGGAEPMMTIPMVDWVAKLGPNRQGLAAYSVAKYGAQTASDPWWPDAGNGILASDESRIVSDPNDAYTPNSPAFQKLWVEHLVNTFGPSANGGIKYYLTDNEHGVWPWNHRPIVPVGPTMDSIRDRIIAYGGAVKEVDPNAQIVGPEEWGWPNYFNSPYDTQFSGGTDRSNHGGWDYMPWLLKEMKAHEDNTGQRLLDVFSLHYYPQYNEFYTPEGDASIAGQLKRNECTRDLWDPSYFSSSWISNTVKLIPRMKEWVNTHYPGTKIAITEYSWGAENHINGAIAQADVLGIFGREGVDLATFWGSLNEGYPIRNSFKMFRNYDGLKSTFGDTSVSATVANPDNVSAFAAERASDGALTVMVLNKYLTGDTAITVNLANFAAGSTAQVWQFTSANSIDRLADVTVTGGSVSFSAPAQSVTLLVIPDSGVVPNNLKAQYSFEGDAQDSSGSGNHGAATALTYVTGNPGAQAAQFDGASSNVSIPRSVTDDFTVAMWVKTTDNAGWPGAQWWDGKGLVDGEVGGGGTDWGTALVDGKFVLGVGSTGGDITLASSVNINDGAWHHVAATRSNTSGAMAVYVDGVLRGSGTGPTGSRTFPPSLRIGSLQTGNNFLNGTLDDVRLYDRILTSGEIAELTGPPPAAPAGVSAAAAGNQIILSWNSAAGASSYSVKRSTSSGGPYTTVSANLADTTCSDTDLSFGTTYYYVVSASNMVGESADSAEASVATASVMTFTSVAAQDGHIRESSETSDTGGTADSTVLRAGDDFQGGAEKQVKALVSFDTSTVPENAVITSAVLRLKTSVTVGTTPFSTHGNCHVDIKGGTGFNGSTSLETQDFQAVADATQVATLSAPDGSGVCSGTLNAAGLAMVDKAATTQLRVYFSQDDNGDNSDDSIDWYPGDDSTASNRPVLEVTYHLAALPSPPSITSAASETGTNGTPFTYQITASNNPASFGASGLPEGVSVDTGSGLISGTPTVTGEFEAIISATNAGGTGNATLTITILPPSPAAPTGLVATGSSAAVALVWNASDDATSYTVLRSDSSGGEYTPLAGGTTTATSYNDTGLADGTTYYYAVRVTNLGGESANSNEAGATTYTAAENWRSENFGTTANTGNAADNADPDGDGWTNEQEFISGTDPNNRYSLLKIDLIQASGNDMNLSFPTILGRTYHVERSDTLLDGTWTTVQENIPGTGGSVQITDTGGTDQDKRFYRIVVAH